jgi:hypothetical protein
MVVALIIGVVKLVPVPNELPPAGVLNQFNVPPPTPEAPNTTVPVPQREPLVTVGAAGIALTVKLAVLVQPSLFV